MTGFPGEPTLPAAFHLLRYATIGSTNDEARRLAQQGAPDRTLVWALEQRKGRGRRGRPWSSPPGNLYASLLLRPDCSPTRAPQLGFVAALALGDALAPLIQPKIDLRYKWPNDLLGNGRKIAGILLESTTGGGTALDNLVIGTGVNLISYPESAEFPATSLATEGVADIAPATVLAAYARCFDEWAGRWREEGFAPVRAAWLARAVSLGEQIRVRLETVSFDGRFLDIDQEGALLLQGVQGQRRITAGEVFPAAS